jgi:uncharacterized protein YjaZ
MKKFLCILLITNYLNLHAQKNDGLQIIDLSQIEIRLLNQYKNADSITKSKIYLDSLYKPYKGFWAGYAGEEADFLSWMTKEGVVFLDYLNKRNAAVNGDKLLSQFYEVKDSMFKLTGYTPVGTWYIVYFHGATDLGGLGNGVMLIDLSHENNSSNDNIMKMFPHEITHQIMNNTNTHSDSTALNSIIGEGFAVYMNQLYWGDKYTLAQNLGYSEEELKACRKHKDIILSFFEKHKFTTDPETIDKFRSRNFKLNPKLPSAIGYYIGYEIIREYAKKSSWKDVFRKSPKVIYQLSGYE